MADIVNKSGTVSITDLKDSWDITLEANCIITKPTGGGRLFDCLPKSLFGWSGARIQDMVQSMVRPVIRGEGSLFAYSEATTETWLRTSATLQVARFQN